VITPRKRAPDDGRVARGAATRANILETAVRIFASHGYSDVTTREIADAAQVNQAAILYYFRSKEGLYLAVAELVADRASATLQTAIEAGARGDSRAALSPGKRLHIALRALTLGFITMATDGSVIEFIVREQSHPGPAFDILYRRYIGHMHARISALVGDATERPVSDRTTIIDAHALIGMSLSFAVARATVLRRMESPRYSARDATTIADRVAELGCRSLGITAGRMRGRPAVQRRDRQGR
jgi:AcrR family transcriptional regulator